jgi:hypothetical protein
MTSPLAERGKGEAFSQPVAIRCRCRVNQCLLKSHSGAGASSLANEPAASPPDRPGMGRRSKRRLLIWSLVDDAMLGLVWFGLVWFGLPWLRGAVQQYIRHS